MNILHIPIIVFNADARRSCHVFLLLLKPGGKVFDSSFSLFYISNKFRMKFI